MPSFAHLSDIHVGAFRQPSLQRLVLDAFVSALDICLEKQVDFVVVSGDLFDSNIPDMGLVNAAVKKMREVREKGIPFYVIYGSHDFSPTQTSIVDILESAGLFVKTTKGRMEDGKLELEFTTDERTGAKLCGISGRRRGIEREYYEILDRENLEREPGFKIFILHGALTEYKPKHLAQADSLPLSLLPRGFAYYAGGHLHERLEESEHGYPIAYPGALFGADYSDLERTAKGLERGFFLVNFEGKLESTEFVPISVCQFEMREYDAEGKNSVKVQNELLEIAKNAEANGKVFLFKITGEMSGGKTTDIDFQQLKRILKDSGAAEVLLNYQQLASKEYTGVRVAGEDIKEIEDSLFKENIGTFSVSNPKLKGQPGIKLSHDVLGIWKQPKAENEVKTSYDQRITSETIDTMGLEKEFE